MKEKFKIYLESIDVTKPIRDKVEKIYEFYLKICPEEINDVFISDYIKEDGTREFDNMWFFSNSYTMEAKQFLSKADDFDMTPIKGRIHYLNIQKRDYDFKIATHISRLYLRFGLDTGISGDLKASRKNCDFLRDTFSKYILPNLKT